MVTTKLELITCGTENFNFSDTTEIKIKGVDTYLCVKDKSYLRGRGAFTSNEYEFIKVLVVPCVNSSSSKTICETKEN